MNRVADKVCLVTGGAMGLGFAEAKALAEEGAFVVIEDVNDQAGQEAALKIGERATFLHLDVCEEANWQAVVAEIMRLHGGLHVLVNNAGILEMADVESCTLDSWRRIHQVCVEGTFLGIKHALPALRSTGAASIINTSSSAALQGVPPVPAYSAAKGAVATLTQTVAVHCIQRGDPVRCNVIFPHIVDTPMTRAMIDTLAGGMSDAERLDAYGVSPQSVAQTVVFLASDESSDLTGAAIRLDRGSTLLPAR